MDSGVKACSDNDTKADGDEKIAEADTETGEAVEALPALVSSCPLWVRAL